MAFWMGLIIYASAQSDAPNQQTGQKALLGATVAFPTGEPGVLQDYAVVLNQLHSTVFNAFSRGEASSTERAVKGRSLLVTLVRHVTVLQPVHCFNHMAEHQRGFQIYGI